MNRPDKAGEPSMDEILASIRQIIAEDPEAGPPSAPDAGVRPPPPKAPAATDANGASPPAPRDGPSPALLERLNGVLKSTPPVGGPFGSKRPLPFDQDLADILDAPGASGSGATAAPKPAIRATPELGAPAAKPPPPAGEAAGGTTTSGPASAALPPQLAPSAPLVPPPPFGSAERSAAAPRPPQTFGFPPLTNKRGFYPPQRSEPVLAPIPGRDGPPAAPGTPPSAADAGAGDDPLKRIADIGAIVPSEAVGGAPRADESAFGAPPRAVADGAGAPQTPSLSDVLPKLDDGPGAVAADPPLSSSPAPGLFTPSPAVSEPVRSAPEATVAERPAAESAKADAVPSAKVEAEAPAAPRAPEKDAAAQALDALAQGLAASAAASAVKPDAAAAPAAPLRPAAAPVPEAEVRLEPAAPAQAAPAARTLEDAVADMLRPMLQQWVADNMPRIMEKALRVEMTRSLGPGSKPPGS